MLTEFQTEIYKDAFALAETNLQRDGGFIPFAIIGSGDTMHVLPAVVEFSEEGKEYFAMMVRTMAVHHHADFIIYVSEAWTISSENLTPEENKLVDEIQREGRSLKEHPKCLEMVMASIETHEMMQISQREIIRSANDWIELMESVSVACYEKNENDATTAVGRFSNLLPPREVQNDMTVQKLCANIIEELGITPVEDVDYGNQHIVN